MVVATAVTVTTAVATTATATVTVTVTVAGITGTAIVWTAIITVVTAMAVTIKITVAAIKAAIATTTVATITEVATIATVATVATVAHISSWMPESFSLLPKLSRGMIYKGTWLASDKAKCVDCRIHMMRSSNGNIFRVTGHLCGEFTGPRWISGPAQRPVTRVTRSSDVFFDLRLSKQSWGWWFETLSCPLWCHSNDTRPFFNHAGLTVFITMTS